MKIKLIVPTELSEIRLSQYQKYYKIQEENKDESFLTTKMIEIFCGIPHKDSFRMKLRDVTKVTNILGDLFNKKPKLKQRFIMNGVEYGFIPNLDDMSLGEYVDLDTYISSWDNMHKAMAVLYRPIDASFGSKLGCGSCVSFWSSSLVFILKSISGSLVKIFLTLVTTSILKK